MTPPKSLGDQARDFFYYVGVAITDWAHIDAELHGIFAEILKCDTTHAAILYYRNPSITGHLEIVNELLRSVFPKPARTSGGHPHPTEKLWAELKKDIIAEIAIRNQLAHSPATPVMNGPPVTYGTADASWASYMSGTEKLRARGTPIELRTEDIQAHLKRLTAIFIRLRNFRHGALPKLLG